MNLYTYIYLLVAALVLFLVFVMYTTRTKPPPKVGKSEYKYTHKHSSLADHAPSSSQEPTHDHNGHKYIKFVPASHLNRRTRRALAKVNRVLSS